MREVVVFSGSAHQGLAHAICDELDVPLLGKVLPGGRAYTYLPASVRRFPGAEELAALLERHGFGQVRFRLMGGTIVALHTAVATAER